MNFYFLYPILETTYIGPSQGKRPRRSHVSLEERAAAELAALPFGPRGGAQAGKISLTDLWGAILRAEQTISDAEILASPAVDSLLTQVEKRDSSFWGSEGRPRLGLQGAPFNVLLRSDMSTTGFVSCIFPSCMPPKCRDVALYYMGLCGFRVEEI